LEFVRELAVQNAAHELIRTGLVQSAHDCSEGGIAVALAECCFGAGQRFGADIDLSDASARADVILFNESQSRIVISVRAEQADTAIRQLGNIPHRRLGVVGGNDLNIRVARETLSWPVAQLYDDWYFAIERTLHD
jgi:phosphoribosylformylglycinamidine synthase